MRVLITGASGRIGKSLGANLLEAGHQVWGVARSSSDILFSGYSICDVCSPSELRSILVSELLAKNWHYLDAIILAAAETNNRGPALTMPIEQWANPLRTCLEGSFYPIHVLFPFLIRSPSSLRRKVICFSGGGADRGFEGLSSYSASKAGLVRLVETLSLEWKTEPVDINIVAPGSHRVPRSSLANGAILKSPEFENLWKMISFLLSNESDNFNGKWISAQMHSVDFLRNNIKTWISDPDEFTLRPKTPPFNASDFHKDKKASLFKRLTKFFK
jgi:3-oxoacyl-[acyl-carrier protein] reductase